MPNIASYNLDVIGTHLRLSLETESVCDALFQSIGERLTRFEQKYSRFIVGNWLDLLNTERGGMLDADGYDMLSYALDVAEKTDGYFDPTIAGSLASLGYGRVEHRGHSVNYKSVHLDGIMVTLESDVILEFGGVGKGYLIDVIKQMIIDFFREEQKPPRFLIDFGGDLYGYGGWKVGLENPHALDEVIGTIVLENHFLACSAGSKRKWGGHHHLLDPKTGNSAISVVATFIEGKSGLSSDTYATAISVMPFELACETLDTTAELEGVILSSDGKLFQTKGSRSELFTE